MQSLDNMKKRLNYYGGKTQDRMIKNKERAMRKAILYAYQDVTIELNDGRQFRAIINPNKESNRYDDKFIAIPFKDIELSNPVGVEKTEQGKQIIGLKAGDVFRWIENDTHWLVYLNDLDTKSYFRANIRLCKHTILVNGKEYYIYVGGPQQKQIEYDSLSEKSYNQLNYSLEMCITKNEETMEFFSRHNKIKFEGHTYEVQAKNWIDADGILTVYLKEDYTNIYQEELDAEVSEVIEDDKTLPYIDGPREVYPYDNIIYLIKNTGGGSWSVDSKKINISSMDSESIALQVMTGKSGEFNLIYKDFSDNEISLKVKINSF